MKFSFKSESLVFDCFIEFPWKNKRTNEENGKKLEKFKKAIFMVEKESERQVCSQCLFIACLPFSYRTVLSNEMVMKCYEWKWSQTDRPMVSSKGITEQTNILTHLQSTEKWEELWPAIRLSGNERKNTPKIGVIFMLMLSEHRASFAEWINSTTSFRPVFIGRRIDPFHQWLYPGQVSRTIDCFGQTLTHSLTESLTHLCVV